MTLRAWTIATGVLIILAGCSEGGPVVDEAKAAGLKADSFPAAELDVFKDMDGGIALTPDEIRGRNTWMMWAAGNQAFWDHMSQHSYGMTDLLRLVDNRVLPRSRRLIEAGMVNEPGFAAAGAPGEYGLHLDVAKGPATAGVAPAIYGYPSGVIGLRLFPNPAFDAKASKRWDGARFATDSGYYTDPDLVRPLRVAMSCAFCHVAHHPLHPPTDASEPEWKHLSTTIGNQWFRTRKIFGTELKPGNFVYHVLDAMPRGTVDTSLIATDGNLNPNTMNPIWQVAERLRVAVPETLGESTKALPDPLRRTDAAGVPLTPHVLADGADSIGIYGALARVYVNIGEYHQEWIRNHNPLVGLRKQTPMAIANMRENSVYWQASEKRAIYLAQFFLKAAKRMPLADAPSGKDLLAADAGRLDLGRKVFAENCIACHSSKQPDFAAKDPVQRLRDPLYAEWAAAAVAKPDFLDENYLSTDERIPVSVVQTNSARALGDNAVAGHIWSDFSSTTYKSLPAVGPIRCWDPFSKKPFTFQPPGGGPGYYRVPPLVGIWATAPFMHNNQIGKPNECDPSVKGRVECFTDACEKLLWPERRPSKWVKGAEGWEPTDLTAGIWRTPAPTGVSFPGEYIPDLIDGISGMRSWFILMHPWLLPAILFVLGALLIIIGKKLRQAPVRITGGVLVLLAAAVSALVAFVDRELDIDGIPAGVPVALLANLDHTKGDQIEFRELIKDLIRTIKTAKLKGLDDKQTLAALHDEGIGTRLLKFSKSPDLIVDRGHWYGSGLSDDEKNALIAFMKTF